MFPVAVQGGGQGREDVDPSIDLQESTSDDTRLDGKLVQGSELDEKNRQACPDLVTDY